MSPTTVLPVPTFKESIIQGNREDGYWLETYWVDPHDKVPGLIGYGLGSGEICIFDNPMNGGPKEVNGGWKRYCVKKLNSPVAVCSGNCSGSGRNDIVICYEYGETFKTANPQGGNISWLENPGRCKKTNSMKEDWKERVIGRWPAMHRLKAGHFTQRSILEIIALPSEWIDLPGDIDTPVPVILFSKPEKALEAIEWNQSIIDDKSFTVIHDAAPKSFEAQGGRDSLFVASREGIDWLHWEDHAWRKENITEGLAKKPGAEYYGSACVDVGRLGGDPSAYIMTIDPFHGGTVTVLTKYKSGPGSHSWIRNVLDVYGTPEQRQWKGTGPGHFVVTADFDNDGDDECLVALMGPSPYKGVYYYKAIDLERNVFAKWLITKESAARIAVGDFNGNGKLDFATISYNVKNYYEEPNPAIRLYTNDFVTEALKVTPTIIGTVWGGEALYYVPKPTDIKTAQTTPLMEVAAYKIQLEIHPPNTCVPTSEGDAIKVLYGQVQDGSIVRRALSVPANEKSSAMLLHDKLDISAEGAILVRFTPMNTNNPVLEPPLWVETVDVPVKNLFEFSYPQLELPEDLKFIKVEDLDWGQAFKGVNFDNMTGIDFRFMGGTHLCHVQFWTAGKGVSAGVHNHSDQTFLEVHLCLAAGTGDGGMWRVKDDYPVDPENPDEVPEDQFIKLPLDTLEQQGGFWERDSYGKPIWLDNGAIKYPWHKWQCGNERNDLDIWVAFEFNPEVDL